MSPAFRQYINLKKTEELCLHRNHFSLSTNWGFLNSLWNPAVQSYNNPMLQSLRMVSKNHLTKMQKTASKFHFYSHYGWNLPYKHKNNWITLAYIPTTHSLGGLYADSHLYVVVECIIQSSTEAMNHFILQESVSDSTTSLLPNKKEVHQINLISSFIIFTRVC